MVDNNMLNTSFGAAGMAGQMAGQFFLSAFYCLLTVNCPPPNGFIGDRGYTYHLRFLPGLDSAHPSLDFRCGHGFSGGDGGLTQGAAVASAAVRIHFCSGCSCTSLLSNSKRSSLLAAMALSKSSSDTGDKEEVCCVPGCGNTGVVGVGMILHRNEDQPTNAGHHRQVRCKQCHNAYTRINRLLKKDDELRDSMTSLSLDNTSALKLKASI